MGKIKAGVVVVTKFCRSNTKTFKKYVDYIDREDAVRSEYNDKFNLYADYMGNPEKTTGLFTEQKDCLNAQDKKNLKEQMQKAQDNGSLMWQTVVSFDNRWLQENGIYDCRTGVLDETKLKEVTRNAVGKMLKNEGLENAVWSAAIHYNTDNIHVHVATVEPEPMRKKKSYIQYQYVQRDGKPVKEPILNADGTPLMKEEYVGRFKGKSIEKCRSSIVNQILNEQEANQTINRIIRENILGHKKENPLLHDKEFRKAFLDLHSKMADIDKRRWYYNASDMVLLRMDLDAMTTQYLKKYHAEEFEELKASIKIQELKYKEAYGDSKKGRAYSQTKMEDLYTRMGNAILKELKEYDKELKAAKYEQIKRSRNFARAVTRSDWLLSSALATLNNSLKKEWEKELNEREYERLSVGSNGMDFS